MIYGAAARVSWRGCETRRRSESPYGLAPQGPGPCRYRARASWPIPSSQERVGRNPTSEAGSAPRELRICEAPVCVSLLLIVVECVKTALRSAETQMELLKEPVMYVGFIGLLFTAPLQLIFNYSLKLSSDCGGRDAHVIRSRERLS